MLLLLLLLLLMWVTVVALKRRGRLLVTGDAGQVPRPVSMEELVVAAGGDELDDKDDDNDDETVMDDAECCCFELGDEDDELECDDDGLGEWLLFAAGLGVLIVVDVLGDESSVLTAVMVRGESGESCIIAVLLRLALCAAGVDECSPSIGVGCL